MNFSVFFFCVILLFVMADPTVWGMLPKAQDDPETIEQAISRLIDVHNDDSTSHVGAGQSLAAHRENEIIDHLAGSVKNDKTSFNNFLYDLKFADYSLWSKYKAGSAYSFHQYLDSIYFETDPSGASGYNRLYRYHINIFFVPSSFYVSANVLTENTPHSSQYWSFGRFDSSLAVDRVSGFKFKTGKLYASLWNPTGPASDDYELVGVDIFDNVEHNLRFYYLATEKKYQWYIDGLLVNEYDNSADTFPPNMINGAGGFDFNFTYDADTDFILYNYDYVFSVDQTY